MHVGRGPKLVKLRCEGCRVDNKRCEDSRPCKHCITKGMPCVNLPRKGRGHGNRVKAACTSCRQVHVFNPTVFSIKLDLHRRDKIRCDGARSIRNLYCLTFLFMGIFVDHAEPVQEKDTNVSTVLARFVPAAERKRSATIVKGTIHMTRVPSQVNSFSFHFSLLFLINILFSQTKLNSQ